MPPKTISEIAKENLSRNPKTAENILGWAVIFAHGKSFQLTICLGLQSHFFRPICRFLHYELVRMTAKY